MDLLMLFFTILAAVLNLSFSQFANAAGANGANSETPQAAAPANLKIPGLDPHEKFPCGLLVHMKAGNTFNNRPENVSQGISAKAIRISSLTENSEENITYIVNVTGTNDQQSKLAVVLDREEDKVKQCLQDSLRLGQNSVQGEEPPSGSSTSSDDRRPASSNSGR